MLPRFHAPRLEPDRSEVTLDADEARHLTRVMRLGVGDRVRVFDGRGTEFLATVTAAARDRVTLSLVERVAPACETRARVTLAQALLKGDAMDGVVRDATMLGVAGIQPFTAARSNVALSAARRGRHVDRWRRIAVGASKQSGRATVPAVAAPVDFEALFESGERLRLILIEPSAADAAPAAGGTDGAAHRDEPSGRAAILDRLQSAESATLIIGPEGGWTPREVECALAHGAHAWTLGARTIRADAMALVALSVLFHAAGEL